MKKKNVTNENDFHLFQNSRSKANQFRGGTVKGKITLLRNSPNYFRACTHEGKKKKRLLYGGHL